MGGMFSFPAYKGVLQQLSVKLYLHAARPCPNHCQMVDRVLASGAIYEACLCLKGEKGGRKGGEGGESTEGRCPLLSENL